MYECFNDFGTRCNRRPIDFYPNHFCSPCLPPFSPSKNDCFCVKEYCRQAPRINVGVWGNRDCFMPQLNISFPIYGWVCFSLNSDER